MNDFLYWMLETHDFWSTLLAPPIMFLYCIYKGYVFNGICAFLLTARYAVKR